MGERGPRHNPDLPGLKRMKAATPPGLCPFCLDPLAKRTGKAGRPPHTCGDEVCRIAWFRCWRRDQRAPPATVVSTTPERTTRYRRRA